MWTFAHFGEYLEAALLPSKSECPTEGDGTELLPLGELGWVSLAGPSEPPPGLCPLWQQQSLQG